MKRLVILLIIISIGFFVIGCPQETVSYCPYCSYGSLEGPSDSGVYTCTNSNCGKKFGAKEIK